MDVRIEPLARPLCPAQEIEIVEHKGLGHPDSICDALAEQSSAALSRAYLERFGAVLHHNLDKALLIGGASSPRFGGGSVDQPFEIIVAGRATKHDQGLDVDDVVLTRCREWLAKNLHDVDVERHVKLSARIRAGSRELAAVFARPGVARANDTSAAVGYAPLSRLERAVLTAAARLRVAAHDPATPAVGEDYKVLGVREGARISLTVACATVGAHVRDLDAYLALKAQVAAMIREALPNVDATIEVNAADAPERGDIYLTVTGTSAEAGDDGEVGRGNRVNGLITPLRPMSLEAAAGKNPISHVGKLYNVAAFRIARAIVDELPALEEAHCVLVSRIGAPIDEPWVASVRAAARDGAPLAPFAPRIEELVREQLRLLPTLSAQIVSEELSVF